jgi:hypothetical protein
VTATSGRSASGGLPAALVALIIAGGVALLVGAAVLLRRRLG